MSASFTAAWLADDPRATALLPRAAADAAGRAAAVAAAAARRVDPAVLEALRARYPDDPRRAPHLDALAAGGAACVVTGQQAGLFGGPLYSIHKAAAAIRDAEALAAETGVPCVPVFWLQSEDHDFAEIATAYTLDARGAVRAITLPAPEDAAGCSVAARPMGAAVDEARAALAETLTGLTAADAVLALIEETYRPDRSPTEAFGRLIDALFARHGLLVVDPRALAAAAAPVHQRAVAEADAIAAALTARVAELDAAGFAVQVHVRPRAPLSFYHPTGCDGPRHRIEPDGDDWRLCGADATVPAAEVAAALADAPEKFSTSALLRPILQDTWLPTAAYIGGPGEIAYFAQLPPLYAHFGLPLPLLVHRARFRLIDSTADRLLDQLGLTPEALAAPRHELLARIGGATGAQPDPDALEAALIEPITRVFEDFAPHAQALDRGLGKLADKTRDTLVDQSRRLVERYRRALAQSDAVATDRLDRLLARLQPEGGPQERLLGWAWYGARHGIDAFIDAIVAAVVPFDGALHDLRFADEARADLLAFGAHPDDVELSCGGWLALASSRGQRVVIVDLTRGELATNGSPAIRAEEAEAAGEVLGVASRENLELPDGELRGDDPDQLAAVVEALRHHRPTLALAPWLEARHPDHAATGHLVERAVFLAGVTRYRQDLGAPHRPVRLVFYPERREVQPSFVVDITAFADVKAQAIACHRSQFGGDGTPTLINASLGLEAFAVRDRYWGATIGVRHGEPYKVRAPIPLPDPLAVLGEDAPPPVLFPA